MLWSCLSFKKQLPCSFLHTAYATIRLELSNNYSNVLKHLIESIIARCRLITSCLSGLAEMLNKGNLKWNRINVTCRMLPLPFSDSSVIQIQIRSCYYNRILHPTFLYIEKCIVFTTLNTKWSIVTRYKVCCSVQIHHYSLWLHNDKIGQSRHR